MVTKMCICGKEFEADEDWKEICLDCYRKKKAQDKKDAEDVEAGTKEADEKYNVVPVGYKPDQRRLEIFKSQCLNIAVTLSQNGSKKNPDMPATLDYIFDLAEKLYKKGIERRFI